MKVVDAKYDHLAPRLEYLSDLPVLAQAWKKTHNYIRHHNWYADTLELDCSAINLEARLREWGEVITGNKYCPEPLRLVPAPKNAKWMFSSEVEDESKAWRPVENDQVLRPLAHMNIQDQTIATAIMLCLADCIETAQGDPAQKDYQKAQQEGVFSYGNRLFCHWEEKKDGLKKARFPWGNSETYSRYFQDYRSFLERSVEIGQQVSLPDGDELFLVTLDLSAFYDSICLKRLVSCLQREYRSFQADNNLATDDDAFWSVTNKLFGFQWADEDRPLRALLKGKMLPQGLPQGMVASGFFANAYMLDFDRAMGQALQDRMIEVQGQTFRIHDYCRYVDDLRLVVSCSKDCAILLHTVVTQWAQSVLDTMVNKYASGQGLSLNTKKTEVENFSTIDVESGISARMKQLQENLSGPFDMATLQQVETGLDGLLALAELGKNETDDTSDCSLKLASISRPKLEVRDDTLTRFAAYRLVKTLRLRKSMMDLPQDCEPATAEKAIDHEFEVTARRLVAAWSMNPSLVVVLKHALGLYPSVELLEPVLEALKSKITSDNQYECGVALYVLAELLRAGATDTGWRPSPADKLVQSNIQEYRDMLAAYACEVLADEQMPWYVLQQVLLFLAVVGYKHTYLPQGSELQRHRVLVDMVHGGSAKYNLSTYDIAAVSLVGHQIHNDKATYARWFDRFTSEIAQQEATKALELVGLNNADLGATLISFGRLNKRAWLQTAPGFMNQLLSRKSDRKGKSLSKQSKVSLNSMICSQANPFIQENALLKLALGLLETMGKDSVSPEALTPNVIKLKCDNWDKVQDTRGNPIKVFIKNSSSGSDSRYATPDWCDPSRAWLYAVGRILRACATGEADFTARQTLVRDDAGPYIGFRSTWQKRRFGMMHSAESLGGLSASITPWFSELLLRMLQWPGLDIHRTLVDGWDSSDSIDGLQTMLKQRLDDQAGIYGKASETPLYVYPIDFPLDDNGKLKVVMVQGILPLKSDFEGDLMLNAPGYRARHRRHLASLMNIIHRKVLAHDVAHGKKQKPFVDLIVFPELSIHEKDIDLIRGLSDATGAIVFAGMTFIAEPASVKPINVARWFIPQRQNNRRSWIHVNQGKYHLTQEEKDAGVKSWRPYQAIIELNDGNKKYRMSGAICYDATDIALAADLRDVSHLFIVPALNKDVTTFDSMVGALRYHMYQHVVVVNSGEFGGSTAQAPYTAEHQRLLAHVHGSNQIAVSLFEINMHDFGPLLSAKDPKIGKTPPAGLSRNP